MDHLFFRVKKKGSGCAKVENAKIFAQVRKTSLAVKEKKKGKTGFF
jgi:hypothetical protein